MAKRSNVRNRWLIALGIVCATSGASAQEPESVTVEKNRGLTGLWQIAVPESIGINLFQSAKFGPMRPIFCRITETLEIRCLNSGYSSAGAVSIDGSAVHIAWGTAMARFVIDGVLTGDTINGTFVFKLSGFSHEAPSPSKSARFIQPAADSGGKTTYLSALIRQLGQGKMTSAYDSTAIAKNGGALPANMSAFGAMQ